MTRIVKRTILGATAAAVVLAGAVGVYATAQDQTTNRPARPFMHRGGAGGPMGLGSPMGMLPRLGRQLQLTDSQRDQLRAIADSHRDEWKAFADRARTARQGLMAAVTADAVDETLIRQKSADVAAVDADMAVARARVHTEVLQILTAEQKTKLKELQTQRQNRMRGRGADARQQ